MPKRKHEGIQKSEQDNTALSAPITSQNAAISKDTESSRKSLIPTQDLSIGQQFQRPSINPYFIKRPGLSKKITEHFSKKDQTILVLTALQGMGKTALAVDYYLNLSQSYSLCAWFKIGDNNESLESQYINLAKKNGFRFPENWSLEEQAAFVKDWLEQQENCLLIYDEVSKPKVLEPFLPKAKSHHIIITSINNFDWFNDKRFSVLEVPAMEEEEAIALLFKMTGLSTVSEEAIKHLAKLAQNSPLVLTQMGAYMFKKKTSASTYLKRYKSHQAELLTEELETTGPKHAPIWITFGNEFETIKRSCPDAWLLLEQMCWLASEPIPEEVLKSILDFSDLSWLALKEQLLRYSLIQINNEGLSMNTVLQDILRSQQPKKALTIIHLCLQDYYKSTFNKEPLVCHLKQLKQHALSFLPEQTEVKPKPAVLPFDLSFFSIQKTKQPSASKVKMPSTKVPEEELFDLCWGAEDMNRIRQLLAMPDIKINKGFFLGDTCLIRAARKGHKELVLLLLQNGADKNIDALGGTAAGVAASAEIKELINAWGNPKELSHDESVSSKNSFLEPEQKEPVPKIITQNYIRNPESGWHLELTVYFYAQLIYDFNGPSIDFQKIIIHTKGNNKFEINFQKPENPLDFEKCLEKFDFQYDLLEKESMNYDILEIDLDQLIEVLNLLHKQNHISEQLLQNIEQAISPDNPDLMKLKQAIKRDSTKSTMIFESNESQQLGLNKNLYKFCANESMKLYNQDDILSAGIPVIELLLKQHANPDFLMNFKTPLMGLIRNQSCNGSTKKIAALLLQYNASLNIPDENGQTALHHAASRRNLLWMEYLIVAGADTTLTDDCGNTPKQVYLSSCKINQIPINSQLVDLFEKTETAPQLSFW